ncbi:NAD(P)-binding protein [Tessaracoccus antarcticus]|nr:NAD(P)-binding protein [Tessaracoccus antarcticus]
MSLVVHGATLSGLAAGARLAKLGHDVELVTEGASLGGRWAATEGPGGHLVDALPQLVSLPATWRDVFKKSGGHLVTELNRAGLALVEAPAVEHRFPDGSTLELPAERGAQFHAISHRFGTPAAERWRDLIDDLDAVWAARRAFGIDGPGLPLERTGRQQLWLDRTLSGLGDRLDHPQLSVLVTDLGPMLGTHSPSAPALLAATHAIDRTFGRWQLVDEDGRGQRASRLVELLADRVIERGVSVVNHSATPTSIDCRPRTTRSLLRPAPRRTLRPAISHALRDDDGILALRTTVEHTPTGPVTTWLRPVADALMATTHDHRRGTPDPDWGLAPDSGRAWLRRTPIVGDLLAASACSPAGNEPWAELASAALAVYELHERLTGEDCRPTNRHFRGSTLEQRS